MTFLNSLLAMVPNNAVGCGAQGLDRAGQIIEQRFKTPGCQERFEVYSTLQP